MKALISILENNFEVEYDFEITASGSPECWTSYGGDPAEPAEFVIEVIEIRHANNPDADPLEIPTWLKDVIQTHLETRDDINTIVQTADQERGLYDPDDL